MKAIDAYVFPLTTHTHTEVLREGFDDKTLRSQLARLDDKVIDDNDYPLTTHTLSLLLAQRSALRPKDTSVIGGELQCEASESYTGAEEYWCT